MALTIWGLIMSCGDTDDVSPYVTLYSEMGLPILDGMADIWRADREERAKVLGKRKTEEVKKYRLQMKSARVDEQQERKQWAKRQQILHSYGNQEEELEPADDQADPVESDDALYALVGGESSTEGNDEGDLLVLGHTAGVDRPAMQTSRKGKEKKPCKCGSTSHSRVSFHGCPLYKK